MKTPYEILNVAHDVNDVEIKRAYLQKVKDNPPDLDQTQFQLIHNAYLSIKDHKSRVSYALFNVASIDFDELIDQALFTEQTVQLTPDDFNKLLRVSVDDATLLKAIARPGKS
jgi:DnaJ-class molecular chaperone